MGDRGPKPGFTTPLGLSAGLTREKQKRKRVQTNGDSPSHSHPSLAPPILLRQPGLWLRFLCLFTIHSSPAPSDNLQPAHASLPTIRTELAHHGWLKVIISSRASVHYDGRFEIPTLFVIRLLPEGRFSPQLPRQRIWITRDMLILRIRMQSRRSRRQDTDCRVSSRAVLKLS